MSNIGRLIYGHCGGSFGRDHYDTCRIEAEGYDWIVVRSVVDASLDFAAFSGETSKCEMIAEWSSEVSRKRWTEDE